MLIYIGKGAILIGVPEHDLTDEDIKASGLTEAELIKSGLYEKPKADPKKPKQETVTND